ncbi:MAG: enoyl-ACP reductase [Proteobacteria bacterium]|nr:enoyl-ACP reductase [Pseudomonadota bacterium]
MNAKPPQIFHNKVGVVMGVANRFSIATGIASVLRDMGAELIFSYLPDTTGKMATRVNKVLSPWNITLVEPCDVLDDQSIHAFFTKVQQTYGHIDFLVHSIAYAPLEDLKQKTINTSRQGFLKTMNVSVYSFLACAQKAAQLMNQGGTILTMSYYGGQKVVPGYNVMGIAKSALEAAVRYISYDLGAKGIRVNAISAGPIKTLAASAVGVSKMLKHYEDISPLQSTVSQKQVGESAAYLLSHLSSGTTGEVVHVDGGYHIMGLHKADEATKTS